jgi:hypothetical protein
MHMSLAKAGMDGRAIPRPYPPLYDTDHDDGDHDGDILDYHDDAYMYMYVGIRDLCRRFHRCAY